MYMVYEKHTHSYMEHAPTKAQTQHASAHLLIIPEQQPPLPKSPQVEHAMETPYSFSHIVLAHYKRQAFAQVILTN